MKIDMDKLRGNFEKYEKQCAFRGYPATRTDLIRPLKPGHPAGQF